MDEIIEGLAEAVAGFYNGYFDGLTGIADLAKMTPQEFNADLWNAVSTTSPIGKAIVAMASILVSLFLCIELIGLFNRSDVKGLDGMYWIVMTFLKMMLALTLCRNMTVIIGACFQISSDIITNMGDLFSEQPPSSSVSAAIENALKDNGNLWDLLAYWLLAFLGWGVNNISVALVQVICTLRFIEIYVFTAVSALAFATFVSKQFNSIGIRHLKRLIALGLQGVFIVIICYMYMVLINSAFPADMVVGKEEIVGKMFELVGYSLLLIIACFQTGGWAKSLLEVN